MFCSQCGRPLQPEHRFCTACGAPRAASAAPVQQPSGWAAAVQPTPLIRPAVQAFVSTIAGDGQPGHRDGPALTARFHSPHGVAIGPDSSLFVADRDNHRIRRILPSGLVTSFAGPGRWIDRHGEHGAQLDGRGEAAGVKEPEAVAIDLYGQVFFGEHNGYRVRVATPDAEVKSIYGARFRFAKSFLDDPVGLAVDASGAVYVATTFRIMRIEPDRTVDVVAGRRDIGFEDGVGEKALFRSPTGLTVDGRGNLFIADRGNHAIRRLDAEGAVTTVAGKHEPGYRDGPASEARFNHPAGIAVAADGTLYVADEDNHRIRAITPDGYVTTIAGDGSQGWQDGPGVQAKFRHPRGLTLDRGGALYVGDRDNHRIRLVQIG